MPHGRRRPRGHHDRHRRLREGTVQRREARVLRLRDRLARRHHRRPGGEERCSRSRSTSARPSRIERAGPAPQPDARRPAARARASRPDVLAAVDGDVRLTYPELDDRVNRLADALDDAGVGPATGSCGSGRTRSGCSSAARRRPSSARLLPRELAADRRRARVRHRRPRRPRSSSGRSRDRRRPCAPRARLAPISARLDRATTPSPTTPTATRRSSPPAPPTTRPRRSTGDLGVSSSTPPRSPGARTARC